MKNNMYFNLMYKTLFTICLLMIAGLSQAQNIEVSGVVLDETGEPLPGVSILVKGTQRGATSGINGDFAIKAGPRATLVFSFIGYEKQEVELKGRRKLRLQMEPAINQLDQVEIVVGYGSQRKEDLTGAISTLPERAERNPDSESARCHRKQNPRNAGSRNFRTGRNGFCQNTWCRVLQ